MGRRMGGGQYMPVSIYYREFRGLRLVAIVINFEPIIMPPPSYETGDNNCFYCAV